MIFLETLNEKEKKRLSKQTIDKMKLLEEYFSIPTFQDFLSEDEKKELKDDYNYFIFEEDEITIVEKDTYTLGQNVYVTFYSENRSYLTGDQIDIITLLHNNLFRFNGTDVNHLKLDNQDRYIDQIVFSFVRILRSGC
ncbi:hypothetical protein [Enterococcus malodoratus]|uniref:hypothetical protein n=1 Tax=Enterococcus malodoratus TaxID=71451 RepID=UPI002072F977|nr:hypothetical protein [Enterococcus malodoratus]